MSTKTYPNARDCEHGSQRGKCADCELAAAEAQVTTLTHELADARLQVEALRGLVSAVSARLTRGEDDEEGDFDRAWAAACAALAQPRESTTD